MTTEAERAYEAVVGCKPYGNTALAVGLVWAIERAPTLLEKVRAAKEYVERVREDEREAITKRYEM
ncbi:MAG: hypothetical protein KGL35_08920 [Bradyrhizobium sp.]|nr:hypothetical protein [Bradyrhizobium sp.]